MSFQPLHTSEITHKVFVSLLCWEKMKKAVFKTVKVKFFSTIQNDLI